MPMDGLMLTYVARELTDTLILGRVDKISQPEQDTLILTIRSQNANHKLLLCASPNNARCHLTRLNPLNPPEPPMFCMLLRKHLLGGRVKDIRQVGGDRQIHFIFECMDEMNEKTERTLILEIMGRHSNLILVNDAGRILDAARHVNADMSRVREVLPGLPYLPPPAQNKVAPQSMTQAAAQSFFQDAKGPALKALSAFVSGLSAASAQEWAFRLTGAPDTLVEDMDLPVFIEKLMAWVQKLPSLSPPVVQLNEDGAARDVFPFPYLSCDTLNQQTHASPSDALEAFFSSRDQKDRILQKSAALSRSLKTHIERCEKKLALQNEELQNAAKMDEYRIKGEILTANLYLLKKGQELVTLPNFYDPDGGTMEIALDKQLTPAQNAQKYFKRYQKARSALETAKVQKEKTEQELLFLEGSLDDLNKCAEEAELMEVRAELEKAGYVRRAATRGARRKLPQSKPYVYLSDDGVRILVGKNSVQNDRLTSAALGDETWLHAKDMPGSHVIIQKEGVPPERTLLQAAQLAAYFSKGRQSAGVPIDYTFRKHVKKPGGSPAGFVIYTNQRTLFMTVSEKDIIKIKEEA